MTEQDRLAMLKIDLKISSTGYDTRLAQYLQAAEKAIKAEGAATLDSTQLEDAQLVVMKAAYDWRVNRHEATGDMYRALRRALNNRIFSEKMKTSEG